MRFKMNPLCSLLLGYSLFGPLSISHNSIKLTNQAEIVDL